MALPRRNVILVRGEKGQNQRETTILLIDLSKYTSVIFLLLNYAFTSWSSLFLMKFVKIFI